MSEAILDTETMAQAVSCAASGIPQAPMVPVWAGMLADVRDGAAWFTGSDGWVTFTAAAAASISEPLRAVVPGRLLDAVLRALPGKAVTLSLEGNQLHLSCGSAKLDLSVLEDAYPAAPQPAGIRGTLSGEDFTRAIRKTAPAAARADSNAALTGLLIEAGEMLEVVATDRYRLAAVTCKWSGMEQGSCLLPASAAEKFARTLGNEDVEIGWDDRVITLRSGRREVTSRVISGEFPKWRKLLPADEPDVQVDADLLTAALKRAQLLADSQAPAELTFIPGEVHISAEGASGQFSEAIGSSYMGEFSAPFSIPNLLDGLSGCDEECHVGFTTPDMPVFIYSGDYRYMILPRRRI